MQHRSKQSRRNPSRPKQSRDAEDSQPMDPVALTLAVWLGLIVGITGLIRLSDNAAEHAAIAQSEARLHDQDPARTAARDDVRSVSLRLSGFGG